MKLILTLLFAIILVFVSSQSTVSAHVLENVENIGAVMHIQPNDDPAAGEESIIFFEFKDPSNVFTPANCDCVFSVEQDGKPILTQPVALSNWDEKLKNVSIAYTFPSKGDYTVKIAGKPSQEETFNEFKLEYDVLVTREQEKAAVSTAVQSEQSINLLPLISIGSLLAVGAGIFMLSRKRKK